MFLGLGCSQRQALFVVLPNPDRTSGAITVSDGQKSILLDKPYAASEEKGGSIDATTIDPRQVTRIFGPAEAALPPRPRHFVIYFPNNTDMMAKNSVPTYNMVFEEIEKRRDSYGLHQGAYQVEVIGYTDTLGNQKYNQELSLKRANAIKLRLIQGKVDPNSISVAGRGDLDPAKPTGPQTPEPLNRRAEITVR